LYKTVKTPQSMRSVRRNLRAGPYNPHDPT
jgi:hypothetical protein